jgi:predicted hydrolase (HD superfamily)
MRTPSKNTTTKTTNRVRSNTPLSLFVKKNAAYYPAKTWVVYVMEDGKRTRPRTFASGYTRDNVRNIYSKAFGIPIQSTRSRRVENY